MAKRKLISVVSLPTIPTILSVAIAGQVLAAGTDSLTLEEVVVVAQKREQSALVVPVAVDTFSVRDITNTGALHLGNIDDYIPGFEAGDSDLTQKTYTVRGVSSANISTGGDPSVATFYDEAYLPRAATTIAFADMERVEVLKGPQGTLFGRNAAAGVINMIPNSPAEGFEGFTRVRYGSENLLRVEAMVNVPVTDDFFVRINGLSHRRDGFVEQVGSAEHDGGEQAHDTARIAGLWRISSTTEAQLSYEWDKIDKAPAMSIGYSEWAYSMDPFDGKQENDLIDGGETRDMYAVTGKLSHDFGGGFTGKWILSYRDYETTNRQDEDGTADATRYLDTDNMEDSDIFYSELRFRYEGGGFDIVFGGNFSQEDIWQTTWINALADSVGRVVTQEFNASENLDPPMDHLWIPEDFASAVSQLGFPVSPEDIEAAGDGFYDLAAALYGQPIVFGPSFVGTPWSERITNTGDFENWGIYVDADYSLTDKINIIAGLRYSEDKKEFSWFMPPTTFAELRPGVPNVRFKPPCEDPEKAGDLDCAPDPRYAGAITAPLVAKDSWSKTTGRLVGQYQIYSTLMSYLSYSTGYKSGGYDSLDITSATSPIRPEESTMYEWGLKGDIVDDVLRTQIAVFRLEVDDRQNTVSSSPAQGVPAVPKVINGNQTFEGIELTLDWLISDTLRFGLVTTYREEESEWDPYLNADAEEIHEKTEGETANNFTLKLDWLPNVPVGEMLVHLDFVYVENTRSRDDSDFFEKYQYGKIPNYFDDEEYLNARIEWTSEDTHWEVALWGTNLLDNEYIVSVNDLSLSTFGTPYIRINEPRMVGMELNYNF